MLGGLEDFSDLERICTTVRRDILFMANAAGSERRPHPGAALSLVEILTSLYHGVITPSDRVVLSKGHGALALYAVLASRGLFDKDLYRHIRSVKGDLQGHPVKGSVNGIDATTGSLGHGLAIGAGISLALRLKNNPGHCFVILGDGELQEGLIWEAALVAANQGIANLVAVIDNNGYQSSGLTVEVSQVEPISDKFKAFGWSVVTCDGHDVRALVDAYTKARPVGGPCCIIALTTKGKGVSFMEGNGWHQRHVDDASYARAIAELDHSA